ncbi:hypothetical protein ANN_04377 [Periplaneta americana]|uniref:Tc1-like transposase DDE domain-containing protein n=1 Tax=Periplaneta americana TaxID=6978 RepID=A0ABQ8T8E6_PERAM|nr:hypothetical protein ANN_04377 [Periplaneta americana]
MKDIVIVLDNALAPSHCEEVMTEVQFTGFQICHLAPYSCRLSPIEAIWSAVKTDIKQHLRENYNMLMRGDPAGILTQKEFRLHFLENTANVAIKVFTTQICLHSANHVHKHYPGAMQLDDMPFGS